MRRLWILAVLVFQAAANDFAGPAACATCHPQQHATQAASRHARALRRIADTPLATLLAAQPLRERSGISFEYENMPGGVRVTAAQGPRTATAVLEWAFGAGGQAITPVGTLRGRFIEHRISWYLAANGARRTMGHPGTPSANPTTALGIVQDAETLYRCFNCHATNVKAGPEIGAMIPGVTCERCHGPAGTHVSRGTRMNSAKLNRNAVMELCGSCHRLPNSHTSPTPERQDPLSIRFAPVGLAASACYRRSNSLSCISCHDPHADASQDASQYDGKCLSCHQGDKQCTAGAASDCVNCHMKKASPAPYLTFTDHRIRVYRQ